MKKSFWGKVNIVGVIAESRTDFIKWKYDNYGSRSLCAKWKFLDKNNMYVCFSEPYQADCFILDQLIETNNARLNPKYDEILTIAKGSLNEKHD